MSNLSKEQTPEEQEALTPQERMRYKRMHMFSASSGSSSASKSSPSANTGSSSDRAVPAVPVTPVKVVPVSSEGHTPSRVLSPLSRQSTQSSSSVTSPPAVVLEEPPKVPVVTLTAPADKSKQHFSKLPFTEVVQMFVHAVIENCLAVIVRPTEVSAPLFTGLSSGDVNLYRQQQGYVFLPLVQAALSACGDNHIQAKHVDMVITEIVSAMLGYPGSALQTKASAGSSPKAEQSPKVAETDREATLIHGAVAMEAQALPYFSLHEPQNDFTEKQVDAPDSLKSILDSQHPSLKRNGALNAANWSSSLYAAAYNMNNATLRFQTVLPFLARAHERVTYIYRYISSLANLATLPHIDLLPLIQTCNSAISRSNTSTSRIDINSLSTTTGSTVHDLFMISKTQYHKMNKPHHLEYICGHSMDIASAVSQRFYVKNYEFSGKDGYVCVHCGIILSADGYHSDAVVSMPQHTDAHVGHPLHAIYGCHDEDVYYTANESSMTSHLASTISPYIAALTSGLTSTTPGTPTVEVAPTSPIFAYISGLLVTGKNVLLDGDKQVPLRFMLPMLLASIATVSLRITAAAGAVTTSQAANALKQVHSTFATHKRAGVAADECDQALQQHTPDFFWLLRALHADHAAPTYMNGNNHGDITWLAPSVPASPLPTSLPVIKEELPVQVIDIGATSLDQVASELELLSISASSAQRPLSYGGYYLWSGPARAEEPQQHVSTIKRLPNGLRKFIPEREHAAIDAYTQSVLQNQRPAFPTVIPQTFEAATPQFRCANSLSEKLRPMKGHRDCLLISRHLESPLPALLGAPLMVKGALVPEFITALFYMLEGKLTKVPGSLFNTNVAYDCYLHAKQLHFGDTIANNTPSKDCKALSTYYTSVQNNSTFSPHHGSIALAHVLYPVYSYVSLNLASSVLRLHQVTNPVLGLNTQNPHVKPALYHDIVDSDSKASYGCIDGIHYNKGSRYLTAEMKDNDNHQPPKEYKPSVSLAQVFSSLHLSLPALRIAEEQTNYAVPNGFVAPQKPIDYFGIGSATPSLPCLPCPLFLLGLSKEATQWDTVDVSKVDKERIIALLDQLVRFGHALRLSVPTPAPHVTRTLVYTSLLRASPPSPLLPSIDHGQAVIRCLLQTLSGPGAYACLLTHPGFTPSPTSMALPNPAIALRLLHWFAIKRILDTHIIAQTVVAQLTCRQGPTSTAPGESTADRILNFVNSFNPARLTRLFSGAVFSKQMLPPAVAFTKQMLVFLTDSTAQQKSEMIPYPRALLQRDITDASLLTLLASITLSPNHMVFANLSKRQRSDVNQSQSRFLQAQGIYNEAYAHLLKELCRTPLGSRRVLDFSAKYVTLVQPHAKLVASAQESTSFPTLLETTMAVLRSELFLTETIVEPVHWNAKDVCKDLEMELVDGTEAQRLIWPGGIDLRYLTQVHSGKLPMNTTLPTKAAVNIGLIDSINKAISYSLLGGSDDDQEEEEKGEKKASQPLLPYCGNMNQLLAFQAGAKDQAYAHTVLSHIQSLLKSIGFFTDNRCDCDTAVQQGPAPCHSGRAEVFLAASPYHLSKVNTPPAARRGPPQQHDDRIRIRYDDICSSCGLLLPTADLGQTIQSQLYVQSQIESTLRGDTPAANVNVSTWASSAADKIVLNIFGEEVVQASKALGLILCPGILYPFNFIILQDDVDDLSTASIAKIECVPSAEQLTLTDGRVVQINYNTYLLPVSLVLAVLCGEMSAPESVVIETSNLNGVTDIFCPGKASAPPGMSPSAMYGSPSLPKNILEQLPTGSILPRTNLIPFYVVSPTIVRLDDFVDYDLSLVLQVLAKFENVQYDQCYTKLRDSLVKLQYIRSDTKEKAFTRHSLPPAVLGSQYINSAMPALSATLDSNNPLTPPNANEPKYNFETGTRYIDFTNAPRLFYRSKQDLAHFEQLIVNKLILKTSIVLNNFIDTQGGKLRKAARESLYNSSFPLLFDLFSGVTTMYTTTLHEDILSYVRAQRYVDHLTSGFNSPTEWFFTALELCSVVVRAGNKQITQLPDQRRSIMNSLEELNEAVEKANQEQESNQPNAHIRRLQAQSIREQAAKQKQRLTEQLETGDQSFGYTSSMVLQPSFVRMLLRLYGHLCNIISACIRSSCPACRASPAQYHFNVYATSPMRLGSNAADSLCDVLGCTCPRALVGCIPEKYIDDMFSTISMLKMTRNSSLTACIKEGLLQPVLAFAVKYGNSQQKAQVLHPVHAEANGCLIVNPTLTNTHIAVKTNMLELREHVARICHAHEWKGDIDQVQLLADARGKDIDVQQSSTSTEPVEFHLDQSLLNLDEHIISNPLCVPSTLVLYNNGVHPLVSLFGKTKTATSQKSTLQPSLRNPLLVLLVNTLHSLVAVSTTTTEEDHTEEALIESNLVGSIGLSEVMKFLHAPQHDFAKYWAEQTGPSRSRIQERPSNTFQSPNQVNWWPHQFVDLDLPTHSLWHKSLRDIARLLLTVYVHNTGHTATTVTQNDEDQRLQILAYRERFENKRVLVLVLSHQLLSDQEVQSSSAMQQCLTQVTQYNTVILAQQKQWVHSLSEKHPEILDKVSGSCTCGCECNGCQCLFNVKTQSEEYESVPPSTVCVCQTTPHLKSLRALAQESNAFQGYYNIYTLTLTNACVDQYNRDTSFQISMKPDPVKTPLFDSFIHLLLEDVVSAMDDIMKDLKQIRKFQTQVVDLKSTVEIESEDDLFGRVQYYSVVANSMISLLHTLASLYPSVFLKEFSGRIAAFLGTYINTLANPEKVQLLNVKKRQETNFKPRQILECLMKMLAKLSFTASASVSALSQSRKRCPNAFYSPQTVQMLLYGKSSQFDPYISLGGLAFLKAFGQPDAHYSSAVLHKATSILQESGLLSSSTVTEKALQSNPMQVLLYAMYNDSIHTIEGEVTTPKVIKGQISFNLAMPDKKVLPVSINRLKLRTYGTDANASSRAMLRCQARAMLVIDYYCSCQPKQKKSKSVDWYHYYSGTSVRAFVDSVDAKLCPFYPQPVPTDTVISGLLAALKGQSEWDSTAVMMFHSKASFSVQNTPLAQSGDVSLHVDVLPGPSNPLNYLSLQYPAPDPSVTYHTRAVAALSMSWLGRIVPLCDITQKLEAYNDSILSNAPDSFLDPVFYVALSQPVRLPSMAVFEWSSLRRHMMTNPVDPMTRTPVVNNSIKVDPEFAQWMRVWRTTYLGDPQ